MPEIISTKLKKPKKEKMKKLTIAALLMLGMLSASAQIDTLQGHYTANKTLYRTKQYILKGYVYIDSLRTLTIESGTVIRGNKATKGTLIISRGAKIRAAGTQSQPIVFTSELAAGSRAAGDWGGVIIAGASSNNISANALLEGGTPGAAATNPTGYEVYHGGTNTLDNSGKMSFVRIEYAGIALFPNQEINGLTLASVGSQTIIHHIQVSYSGDDSYEWFGGNVNTRQLVAYKGVDDDFDCDNGYRGSNQWGMSIRDKNIADASKSNSFEIDNNSSSSAATPKTRPIFTNYSIFGPAKLNTDTVNSLFQYGAHIRRNSEPAIYNSIITGFPTGIAIDGSTTITNANTNLIKIRNTVIGSFGVFGNAGASWTTVSGTLSPDNNSWFATRLDSVYGTYALLNTRNVYVTAPTNPDPRLKCISKLVNGADTTDGRLTAAAFIDHNELYRGGFDCAYDWSATWTEYNPQGFNYCIGCATRIGGGLLTDDEVLEETIKTATKVSVYPNPTNGSDATITFEIEGEISSGSIELYDLSGRRVYTQNVEVTTGFNQFNINTTGLPVGIYMIHATAGNQVRVGKVVISE